MIEEIDHISGATDVMAATLGGTGSQRALKFAKFNMQQKQVPALKVIFQYLDYNQVAFSINRPKTEVIMSDSL